MGKRIAEAPCPHCGETVEVYENTKGDFTGDCLNCKKVFVVEQAQVREKAK